MNTQRSAGGMASWIVACLAITAGASIASADEFSDFRIPAHRYRLWTLGLVGRVDDGDFNGLDGTRRDSRGDAQFAVQGYWATDSDPHRTQVSASGRTFAISQSSESATISELADLRQRRANESVSLAVDDRHYPWVVPVGFAGTVAASADYSQSWDHAGFQSSDRSSRSLSAAERWSYQTRVTASLGFGWGRVRDATPVMEARYLEARLLRSGVISRTLSSDARERLTRLLAVRRVFGKVADRPARSLWDAIYEILAADGVLADRASDPGAWTPAFEPYFGRTFENSSDLVPDSPIVRTVGWFIGPVFTYDHIDDRTRVDSRRDDATYSGDILLSLVSFTASARAHQWQDHPAGGVQGEYHRPLGLGWQWDMTALLVVPLKDREQQFSEATSASIRYLHRDRWSAGLFAAQYRTIADLPPIGFDGWSAEFGGQADFYLEDHLALTLRASESQARERSSATDFRRALSASVGLTYRISGAFDAPGVFSPTLGAALPTR